MKPLNDLKPRLERAATASVAFARGKAEQARAFAGERTRALLARLEPGLQRARPAAERLKDRAEPVFHRAKGPVAVGAGFLVLAAALSASSTPGPVAIADPKRVAQVTKGDFSDAALKALTAGMDPAALTLARRHDPYLRPEKRGGWADYSITDKPDFNWGTIWGASAQKINALVPAVQTGVTPARPFFVNRSTPEGRRALRCLTQAVYHEAALESREGQEGVAQVVLNRVRDPNFPNTICGVVFQGAERATGCQFSFTCDGALARGVVPWAWRNAEDVAIRALSGYVAAKVGTATHYHADYVLPWWSPTVQKIGQVGRHIFYRWTGAPGELSAFRQRYAGREPYIDEARFARRRIDAQMLLAKGEAITAAESAAGVTLIETPAGPRVGMRLGGRRTPTKDEVAQINAALARYDGPKAEPAPAAAPTVAAPAAEGPVATAPTTDGGASGDDGA